MPNNELKIEDIPLLSKASKDSLEYLRSHSDIVYLKPRQTAYKEGASATHVYLVLHGGLKVQKSHGEDITIFDFITRGCLGGYLYNLEENRTYMFTGIALEHTSVLAIPTNVFEEFLMKNPDCFRLVQRLIGRFMNEMQQDRSMAKERVPYRLAAFLLNMQKRQSFSNCNSIMLKLSRHDIAGRIGSEPETIIRVLTKWTQQGAIETKNKIISIKDKNYLEELLNAKSGDANARNAEHS